MVHILKNLEDEDCIEWNNTKSTFKRFVKQNWRMRRNKEQRQICNLSYNYSNRVSKVNNENIEKK